MAAHGLSRRLRRERSRGDVIARLEAAAVSKLGPRLHADDRRRLRQAQLAGKPALSIQPLDFFDDAHASLLDAAVAFVAVDEGVDLLRRGESAFDLGAQRRVIWLERQ